jgi:hypothetical protein
MTANRRRGLVSASRVQHISQQPITDVRSTIMYTLQEALARDRMREQASRSSAEQLARGLAAERRWHRVSRYASGVHARRAARLRQLAAR